MIAIGADNKHVSCQPVIYWSIIENYAVISVQGNIDGGGLGADAWPIPTDGLVTPLTIPEIKFTRKEQILKLVWYGGKDNSAMIGLNIFL